MLKIGLPYTQQNNGPKIFLRRLEKSFKKQKLAKSCHFINPFHHIDLFSSNARNYYKKPYVVKLVFNRQTKKIIGGQIISDSECPIKHIDVIALAIRCGLRREPTQ